jgi:PBSX family phage terminase large subunit
VTAVAPVPDGTLPDGITLGGKFRPLFTRRPQHRYVLDEGGRGSAKSWHVAMAILNLTYEAGHVILYTRWTMVSAEISIIPEFVEKITLLNREDDFDIGATEIVNIHTGSRILFRGIKTSQGTQTANLKSIHGVTVWVLDEAEEMPDEETFDKIDLSIRTMTLPNRVLIVLNPGTEDHWIFKRWHKAPAQVRDDAPECESGVKGCVHRDDTLYLHSSWEDNRANLSAEWIQQAERMRVEHPMRYRSVFGGKWAKQSHGGVLWQLAHIERARLRVAPDGLIRVLVGVDPATTATMASDETGIVVVGVDRDKKGYVLEDLSGRYSPRAWAALAVSAAQRWQGSIVAETNNGGDLVVDNVKAVNPSVRVLDVKATRGKLTRAEPAFALYESGRMFHCGEFPHLEREMLAFNPVEGADLDDRVDALVWAVTKLLIDPQEVFVV